MELAEELDLRKRDRKGSIRDFTVNEVNEFLDSNAGSIDILSTAEKQSLVRHELENIRALENEFTLPGYSSIHLYEGQSIRKFFLKSYELNKLFETVFKSLLC